MNIDSLATKHDIESIRADIALVYSNLIDLKSHVNTFGYLICSLIVVGLSLLGYIIKH